MPDSELLSQRSPITTASLASVPSCSPGRVTNGRGRPRGGVCCTFSLKQHQSRRRRRGYVVRSGARDAQLRDDASAGHTARRILHSNPGPHWGLDMRLTIRSTLILACFTIVTGCVRHPAPPPETDLKSPEETHAANATDQRGMLAEVRSASAEDKEPAPVDDRTRGQEAGMLPIPREPSIDLARLKRVALKAVEVDAGFRGEVELRVDERTITVSVLKCYDTVTGADFAKIPRKQGYMREDITQDLGPLLPADYKLRIVFP
jgi:hypothetical protein